MDEILIEHDLNCANFLSFAIDREDIYLFCLDYNGLYRLDTKSGKMTFISSVPGESTLKQLMCYRVYLSGFKLYLLPTLAKTLYAFDLNTREIASINLPCEEKSLNDKRPKLYAVAEDEKKIYFVGDYSSIVLELDKDTQNIKYFNFVKQLRLFSDDEKKCLSIRNAKRSGDYLLLACGKRNIIIAINVENYNVKEIVLPYLADDEGVADLIENDGIFWILTSKNKLLLKTQFVETEFRMIKKYTFNRSADTTLYDVGKICYENEALYILPLVGRVIYKFDLKEETCSIYDRISEDDKPIKNRMGQAIPFAEVNNSNLYYLDGVRNKLVIDNLLGEKKQYNLECFEHAPSMLLLFITDVICGR